MSTVLNVPSRPTKSQIDQVASPSLRRFLRHVIKYVGAKEGNEGAFTQFGKEPDFNQFSKDTI